MLNNFFNTFGNPGGGMGGMGFPMGGGMMGSPAPQGPFKSTYRCYPVVMMGQSKADLEKGDKIILPASALDTLARLRVTYPMMFSLVNPRSRRESRTHSGVMEFSAEEGQCYVPYWMMQNLLIESGGLLEVTNVSLRKGTYVKLQPHSVKFTQLHNPRVVLERALRNFSCLTKGDTIAIQHGTENFYLDVMEVKPDNAVSIIETDMNVDFEAAKDAPAAAAAAVAKAQAEDVAFVPSVNTIAEGVTAADRDFSSGGWGSGGTAEEEAAAAKASAASSLSSSSSAAAGGSSSSDYFAKLGAGNKLTAKRTSAGNSASSSAQPSPSPSPHLGPSSISSSSSLNALSSLRPNSTTSPAPASGMQRPGSALAGRSGGYSLTGSSNASSAAAASSSSSSTPVRPVSSSSTASPSSALGVSSGKQLVVQREGAWMYHYEVDDKGGKRLIRRLPAKEQKPAQAAAQAASSSSSSSSTAAAASPLAALGPGHRLK